MNSFLIVKKVMVERGRKEEEREEEEEGFRIDVLDTNMWFDFEGSKALFFLLLTRKRKKRARSSE